MNRFTGRNGKGDLTLCGEQVCGNNQNVFYNALLELEKYELTGLEPDKIPQLQEKYDTAIKVLSGAILEKAEIPQWISCSERLPEKWHNENGEPIEFNVMLPEAKDATTLCFNGSQWFEFDWKYMRITGYYSVTHWQPLPQPPKGEKQ